MGRSTFPILGVKMASNSSVEVQAFTSFPFVQTLPISLRHYVLKHLVHLSLHKQKLHKDSPSHPPDTKNAKMSPTKRPRRSVSRPDPIDDETLARTEARCKQILQERVRIIQDRVAVAAAAALECEPAVKFIKECIIEKIKDEMVWTRAFRDFEKSKFGVGITLPVGPESATTIQILRAIFPGVGSPRGKGKEKGWHSNVYSCAEFRDLMGTDVLASVGSSIAELTGDVSVKCLLQAGDLRIRGMYRELERWSFSQTAARR